MYGARCPLCEANLSPSQWIVHQRMLHSSGLGQARACSNCLFQSQALRDLLSHAFLEGHELPAISALNLSRICLPMGPQRIPLSQIPLESTKKIYPERENQMLTPQNIAKSLEATKSKTPNLPLQSSHRTKRSESKSKMGRLQTSTFCQNETASETEILIRDDTSDFATSYPATLNSFVEPAQSEEVVESQEENTVESYLCESFAMMAEERSDSTDIPMLEIVPLQDKAGQPIPPANEITSEPSQSSSFTMTGTKTGNDDALVELASSNHKLGRLISLETNPDLLTGTEDAKMLDFGCESETDDDPQDAPCTSQEETSVNAATSHVRKIYTKKRLQCARCTKCTAVVKFRNPSVIIRHVLSCQGIRPYACRVCLGSWPTLVLAKRHVLHCPGGNVFLRDRKQSEQAAWNALHACFPGLPVIWKGLKSGQNSSAVAIASDTRQLNGTASSSANPDSTQKMLSKTTTSKVVGKIRRKSAANRVPAQTEIKSKMECARCLAKMPENSSAYDCKRHVISHLPHLPYQCSGCNQRFRDKQNYFPGHILFCEPFRDTIGAFNCFRGCGLLGAELQLVNEKEHVIAIQQLLSECFPRLSQTHFQDAEDQDMTEISCSYCFTRLRRARDRGRDMSNAIIQHVTSCQQIRPYRCTGCNWRPSRKDNAGKHFATRCITGAELVVEDETGNTAKMLAAINLCFPNESVTWNGLFL